MDRAEAVKLLKEMVILGLVLPSFVSIDKNKQGGFILVMNSNGSVLGIRAFLSDKDLVIFEDKEKGTWTIYKP